MRTRLSDVMLAARMLCWLVCLPVLKRIMPLRSLVVLMGATRRGDRPATEAEIERMSAIARWLAVHTWPRRSGTCLEQSLVLYRFLSARSIPPELVIGVRRHDERIGAHAWVTVNGRAVGHSAAALTEFSPILSFGPHGSTQLSTR